MIKIGDRVKFINDTNVGIVKSIKNAMAIVEVEDGFDMPAMITELVVVAQEDELRAIQRIGVSDERPGVKGKVSNKGTKEPKKQVLAAYKRYGKVSLIPEEDDGEDIVDVNVIKEQYLRNMVALNNKQMSMSKTEGIVNDQSVFDDVKPKYTKEDYSTTVVDADPIPQESLQDKKQLDVKSEKQPTPHIVKHKQAADNDIEIVDLHANELMDSTKGMTPYEILSAQMARFTIVLDTALSSGKKGKIVFIHGVGTGKLKYEIKKCLDTKYSKVYYQDASFREYGYGAIMVFYN